MYFSLDVDNLNLQHELLELELNRFFGVFVSVGEEGRDLQG